MAKVCFEDKTLNMFFFVIILLVGICYHTFNKMKLDKDNSENNNENGIVSNNNDNKIVSNNNSCNLKLENSKQELIESNKKLIEVQKDLSDYKDNLSSCKLEKVNQQNIVHTNEGMNYKRLSDPLLPPERTYPYMKTQMLPINIPTRGYPEEYQQYGILSKNHSLYIIILCFGCTPSFTIIAKLPDNA